MLAIFLGAAATLMGGLTHYGHGPAPIFFGSTYVEMSWINYFNFVFYFWILSKICEKSLLAMGSFFRTILQQPNV